MNARRRFFRTRPTAYVIALLVLAVVAEVAGFALHGTPMHYVYFKNGARVADQPTGAIDYLKFALKIGGIGLVLAAALLHGDRLDSPEELEGDAAGARDLEAVNRRTVIAPNPTNRLPY
jgi:hypothetical protein